MNENENKTPENKMGTEPIGPLLIHMALPLMISMLVQALYNIVDSIYVSRINEAALTAVSMAFPIQTLMVAVIGGTAVGMNAMLSRSLGEKNFRNADSAANTGVFLMACSYICFVLIGLFLSKPFYMSQISYDMEIVNDGISYMTICCVFSLGFCCQMTFERIMQGTGLTIYTMIVQSTGALINIFLDPMFIFGIGFFPKLGVAGAAVATCCGQTIAGIMAILFNHHYNHDIHIRASLILHPSGMTVRQIYRVGVPSIIMQCVGSIMYYGMNLILTSFNSTASAVFGVYYKLQSFFFMPIFGMNNAIVPIMAYNFGARSRKRMIGTLKTALRYAFAIMCIGTLCFELIPDILLGFFAASENMLAIGEPALRIIGIHFPVAAVCIILGTTFQALSKATFSALVSLGRQLIVLLPAAYILAEFGGLGSVWWCFPIAEVVSLILTLIFFSHVYRTVILQIPEG